ncbi:MAG: cupin-like domain-containing protein, partial [Prolixibacteraceae bacterium]|nr:cupin-like domain-containing protein [Burkholderiales bacterium]
MSSAFIRQKILPSTGINTDPGRHLLQMDPQMFRRCFDRMPFLIGHHLAGHPLFELSRLTRLSQTLPEANVEYNAGDIPISLAADQTPRNGLSPEETIRRIAQCKSWLVLKNVEHDPEYGALLHRCLGEVARHSEPIRTGMCLAQAFIFISSPGSVTPYHMDPEHNFLLQIRGSKRIRLFDGRDRSILSEEELEQHYGGAHRNLVYRDDLATKGWTFEL